MTKGSGAFYHKIGYDVLPENEAQSLVKGFYEDILNINEQKVILAIDRLDVCHSDERDHT